MNIISVKTEDELQGLITFANILYLYCMWLVPEHLITVVYHRVEHADKCVGNIIMHATTQNADAMILLKINKTLCIGSPIEYLLELKYDNLGFTDGAKHLLNIEVLTL